MAGPGPGVVKEAGQIGKFFHGGVWKIVTADPQYVNCQSQNNPCAAGMPTSITVVASGFPASCSVLNGTYVCPVVAGRCYWTVRVIRGGVTIDCFVQCQYTVTGATGGYWTIKFKRVGSGPDQDTRFFTRIRYQLSPPLGEYPFNLGLPIVQCICDDVDDDSICTAATVSVTARVF